VGALATLVTISADMRLTPQSSSSPSEACIVVSSAAAEPMIEALRREFAQDTTPENVRDITLDPFVAIVGGEMLGRGASSPGHSARWFVEKLHVFAGADSLQSSFSFGVATCDMNTALLTTHHRELQLSAVDSRVLPRQLLEHDGLNRGVRRASHVHSESLSRVR
jgi:hypothetical protein